MSCHAGRLCLVPTASGVIPKSTRHPSNFGPMAKLLSDGGNDVWMCGYSVNTPHMFIPPLLPFRPDDVVLVNAGGRHPASPCTPSSHLVCSLCIGRSFSSAPHLLRIDNLTKSGSGYHGLQFLRLKSMSANAHHRAFHGWLAAIVKALRLTWRLTPADGSAPRRRWFERFLCGLVVCTQVVHHMDGKGGLAGTAGLSRNSTVCPVVSTTECRMQRHRSRLTRALPCRSLGHPI